MNRRIGVDLGMRSSHKVVVVNESGIASRPTSIDVSIEGFLKLRDLAFNGCDRCTTQVVIEPTGNVWLPLAAFLSAHGIPVVVSNTRKVSDFRKVLRRHVKTDVVDAEAMARLAQVDPKRSHVFEMPSADVLSLRRLLKQRDRFVRDATASKLRIHAALQMTNPRLVECFGEEKFSSTARVMYREFVDPFSVLRLGEKGFAKRLRQRGARAPEEQVRNIFAACEKTCALYEEMLRGKTLPFEYEFMAREIGAELSAMEVAEAQVKALDGSIKELYSRVDPAQTLRHVPGMGDTIAAGIEALSSPIDRFRNAKAYASYSGLVPRMSQTGIGPHDGSHNITKSGHRLLKKYFHLAGETARRVDPELAAYYAAKSAAGWHHGRIMTAIAHMLVRRAYALLRRRENDALRPTGDRQAQTYHLRTPQGETVDRKVARAYIVEHYPSKREQARRMTQRVNNKRDAAQLGNEGQPEGSTNRVMRARVPQRTIPQDSARSQPVKVTAGPVENPAENRCVTNCERA